eukprot:UN12711
MNELEAQWKGRELIELFLQNKMEGKDIFLHFQNHGDADFDRIAYFYCAVISAYVSLNRSLDVTKQSANAPLVKRDT